ncbi:hypothetical protein BE20_36910 [Sorangium cellulosum]|uniref:L-lysine 6-monooxygenase n=1 Tax=Sorangium cellulosum TaxID=56 RepID=A0A150SZK3_SORCE|nr:hypothetical protein BE18_04640 [Sorangium cellulosum]KYF97892.1 hypothetical protein BE20_36910 [Sorangium cellulosum]
MKSSAKLDAIGVGIGPFNLSAAALCAPIPGLRTLFLDRKREFSWHPGLLISGATIQTSHLKDLVTLADPRSAYGFLSYLHAHGRMYRFNTANFKGVERAEFDDYFRWVSKQLTNLRFGVDVESLDFDGDHFVVNGDPEYTAKNLILGTGLSRCIPECAEPLLGDDVFHGDTLLNKERNWTDRRVAIVGGGQSGAEIFNYLISSEQRMPSQLCWVSSRSSYLPLDDSPFTNELFTPGYSNYFFELPLDQRIFAVESQKLASDGISMSLLEEIYRRLYSLEFLRTKKPEIILRPNRRMAGLSRSAAGDYCVTMTELTTKRTSEVVADIVILCTGYEYRIPRFLSPLRERIRVEKGGYVYNRDFSIKWDGPAHNKIYVQNAAINARGIADPNLSLMAWRSANIINDLVGEQIYKVQNSKELQLWI